MKFTKAFIPRTDSTNITNTFLYDFGNEVIIFTLYDGRVKILCSIGKLHLRQDFPVFSQYPHSGHETNTFEK